MRFCCLLLVLVTTCKATSALADTSAGRPNVLLMVADDLGYGDVGCYGATKIKTPRIDRLAAEGVRFTDAHSTAAVCNPSRYAILSGTYLCHAKRKADYSLYFHEGQATLPSVLKASGYRTAALGKWHNGFGRNGNPDWNAELKPGPLEIGFDYFFGTPRTHNEPPFVFVENHRVVDLDPSDPIRVVSAAEAKEGWGHGVSKGATKAHAARPDEKIDFIMAEKAAAFLASQPREQPFFLYIAFAAPHVPINPAPEFRGKSQAGLYGDYIEQLDHCTGLVLDALTEHGFADSTLVVFTSDNGAVLTRDALEAGHRPNGNLLGQKTDAWEGGHRVPLVARWPGRIPPGSKRAALFSQVDLMATVAAAAGAKMPAGASPDGQSELAAFLNPSAAPAIRVEGLFQGTGGYALRQGQWIYMPKQGSGGMTVQVPAGSPWGMPYEKLGLVTSDIDEKGRIKPSAPPSQLYDLGEDVGQKVNRMAQQPKIAERMAARLDELLPRAKARPQGKRSDAGAMPSRYYAVDLSKAAVEFSRFAIDSLGQGRLGQNPALAKSEPIDGLTLDGQTYRFHGEPVWQVVTAEKTITLRSTFAPGAANWPFALRFDQKTNHATLLGRMKPGERTVALPCLLHLPDMGTMRITANLPGAQLKYDARRRLQPAEVSIAFPAATAEQKSLEYRLEVVSIYPGLPGIKDNSLYDGFRRDWLNIFQVNPRVQMLANNASSDPCSFTLFEYSDLARHTPPLADGLTANDLVRMTLDRYIAGAKGYGQVGYACAPTDADLIPWKTPWTSLDTLPSLVISACNYTEGARDSAWARANYAVVAGWVRAMFAADHDGNGLIEYPGSGNLGDRPLRDRRPSNWWDTVNFGHEDAFANALAYRAATMFAELAGSLGHGDDAAFARQKAAKLRSAYVPTFLNPDTGVLAGWKSKDGQLHDYWFTFVQGAAISYGLVDDPMANKIMDRLLAKMKEVGFARFDLGLPGNLIPIKKGDYVHEKTPPERFGEPLRDDGSDGFQYYENGGATGCWAYYTVKALFRLGRRDDARRILRPMLAGYASGTFQGFGDNGMSRDWRDWQGGCHGYEGLLVDNYHALLAVLDDVKPEQATATKPWLWAMYYAWYETATGRHGRWRMWSDDKTTARQPKPQSKAEPLVGYYDSDDSAVVRWHFQLAKAAGIDGFLVSWWGGANLSGRAFEEVIVPVAAQESFKVAMCSELAQFHSDAKTLTEEMANTLARVIGSPAYLRVDGKPVVYLYQVPFAPKLTPETLRQVIQGVEAAVGPVYWVMDKVANPGNRGLEFPPAWLAVNEVPMFGFYGTFSVRRAWTYDELAPDYARLASQAHAAGKRVFLPVHPGHDNSGFRPNDYFIIPRDGGATLRGYLRAATDAGADAIVVTSFNEWPETTVVEPSSSWPDPYLYLKILAEWKGVSFVAPSLPRR